MSLFRITFLAFDEPESKFALNEAASSAGGIIGLLATKAVTEVAPSTVPVSDVDVPLHVPHLLVGRTQSEDSLPGLSHTFGLNLISPGIHSFPISPLPAVHWMLLLEISSASLLAPL